MCMHIPLHTHSKQEHEGVEPISTLRVVAEIVQLGREKVPPREEQSFQFMLKNVDFLGATPKVYLLVSLFFKFQMKDTYFSTKIFWSILQS